MPFCVLLCTSLVRILLTEVFLVDKFLSWRRSFCSSVPRKTLIHAFGELSLSSKLLRSSQDFRLIFVRGTEKVLIAQHLVILMGLIMESVIL